jgi:hypothetical protein
MPKYTIQELPTMRKLTLKTDDLRVESFETHTVPEPRGTVEAHATNPCIKTLATCPYTCDDLTCVGSCQGTSCQMPLCNTCEPGGPCQVIPTNPCTS